MTYGFKNIDLDRGSHTIALNFKRSNNGRTTLYIWNTRLEIIRIK